MALTSLALMAAGSVAVAAQPITTDSRIKTFVYSANEVFAITTHYGYQSNIEFGLRETIETVSVGDRVGWQIIPSGRRMFIRAMEENAHTNMTVVTNQRAYQFDLRSSSSDVVFGSEQLTYVVRFFYPDDVTSGAPMPVAEAAAMAMPVGAIAVNNAPAATPDANARSGAPIPTAPVSTAVAVATAPTIADPSQAPAPMRNAAAKQPALPPVASLQPAPSSPVAMGLPSLTAITSAGPATRGAPPVVTMPEPAAAPAPPAPGAVNYRYTYSGPTDIAPVKIYDDGRTTYFKFAASESPQIAVLTAKGEALSVNARRTAEGLVAVDAIAPRFSLKQGGREVLVYNESTGAN